ncbi:MAG: hypothetical protein OEY97_11700, partial [Nitrospirota bacterium]|nr:hypothetical protein [Nitrospirota bacterium]
AKGNRRVTSLMKNRFVEKIKRWYEGELEFPENNPDSQIVIISPGHYKRSASSRSVHLVVDFHRDHWKWAIPVYLGFLYFVMG